MTLIEFQNKKEAINSSLYKYFHWISPNNKNDKYSIWADDKELGSYAKKEDCIKVFEFLISWLGSNAKFGSIFYMPTEENV